MNESYKSLHKYLFELGEKDFRSKEGTKSDVRVSCFSESIKIFDTQWEWKRTLISSLMNTKKKQEEEDGDDENDSNREKDDRFPK